MLFSVFFTGIVSALLFLLFKNVFIFDLFGAGVTLGEPEQSQDDVRNTCRIVSGFRAIDSAREDSVYSKKDPLAAVLAGETIMASLRLEASRVFREPTIDNLNSVTLRQLSIDGRIERYCGGMDPQIRQVVLIGAGMDSRPYRLSLPGVNWFEIDMPEVIALKEKLISSLSYDVEVKNASLTRIPLNLKNDVSGLSAVLAGKGHDISAPTLFLMEGLLMYLSPTDIRNLISALPVTPSSRAIASQVSFKYHFILTSPLVTYVIETFTQSTSHKIATLWKSNMLSMSLAYCLHPWRIENEINIGVEMKELLNVSQWQLAGTKADRIQTAESVIDMVPY